MAEPKPKEIYGPVPMRAVRDRALTEHPLRTLIAVAGYDRLNKNGKGCYAGLNRLAEIVGGGKSRVQQSLTLLVGLGYLELEQGERSGRQFSIYRVVYTADDRAMMGVSPDT